MGICVDYHRLLRIETQLTKEVVQNSIKNYCFILSNLIPNKFIFFAADNSDFLEDTVDGRNTLHATAMVVFQKDFSTNLPTCVSTFKGITNKSASSY